MRTKLITHYELASLIESKKPKNDAIRKRLRDRILSEMHDITDIERANVLTCNLWQINVKELQSINLGNAIRRLASNYGKKS
jgi:hypothetical protein